jgi:Icc-related predicted phosphoesterase
MGPDQPGQPGLSRLSVVRADFFRYHLLVPRALFVSDLHGRIPRYEKLFAAISREKPAAVFIGGDFLPHAWYPAGSADRDHQDFVGDFLAANLLDLRRELGASYPRVFLIMGNDDARLEEAALLEAAERGIWEYAHNRKATLERFEVYGYAFVPPTPFLRKDWDRYDVSRYVDPGAVGPEEGIRTVPASEHETRYATIKDDLDRLVDDDDLTNAIFLFHAPPYQTNLDWSLQGGRLVDHVPLDRHLGSIAVRRFIESRQPLLTLHGHVHEAARLSGSWRDRLGRTHCFSAAHDGPELALVRFDLDDLDAAPREFL